MRFFDVLKVALHNMWNNKTRTALVTLVLFILSTLVSVILAVGINFTNIISKAFSYDTAINLSFTYFTNNEHSSMSDEQINNIMENIYEANNDLFVNIDISMNSYNSPIHINEPVIALHLDSNIYEGYESPLVEGRLWNKSDSGKNYAWISKDYALSYNVGVNDSITITTNSQYGESETYEYVVMGIVNGFNMYNQYSNPFIMIDYKDLMSKGLEVSSITLRTSNIEKDSSLPVMLRVSSIIKEFNEVSGYGDRNGLEVSSYEVTNKQMSIYISIGIVAGVLILSLILMLMSIGCVSNSIQITVEQNRKFFGMMKAIGLRNNTVKKIVRWQAVIMILLAVILASIVTFLVMMSVESLVVTNLIPLMFGSEGVNISFGMPFYVPLIVFFMLVGLVMLFTIKSLNKISKMDVVSVISEVN